MRILFSPRLASHAAAAAILASFVFASAHTFAWALIPPSNSPRVCASHGRRCHQHRSSSSSILSASEHFSTAHAVNNSGTVSAISHPVERHPFDRREVLRRASSTVAASLTLSSLPWLARPEVASATLASELSVYRIRPDATSKLRPELESVTPGNFRRSLAFGGVGGGAVWLGEHHNSATDHRIQAELIQAMHTERANKSRKSSPPMAIGLEQVQVQFQSALDDYVSGKIDEAGLLSGVDWNKRWTWSFEAYRPVFEVARELGIQLLALNVDSEDLAKVERGGFPGLGRELMGKYVTDPAGFASMAQTEEYKTYIDYVIRPSYDLHRNMGLLQSTISGQRLDEPMPFRNFFSGRILWDEAMASRAYAWTKSHTDGLLVGLVGADHVKFGNGIPGRYGRMARGQGFGNASVMINPTLVDTRPPGSVGSNVFGATSSKYPDQITLQLRYLKDGSNPILMSDDEIQDPSNTGGVLPLADYIVIGA